MPHLDLNRLIGRRPTAARKCSGSPVRTGVAELSLDARQRYAIAILVYDQQDKIQPMNKLQQQRWDNDGFLVCPHGSVEWALLQVLPVWWRHEDDESDEPKKPAVDGTWTYESQVGPYWCECSHGDEQGPVAQWWPPEDAEWEFE